MIANYAVYMEDDTGIKRCHDPADLSDADIGDIADAVREAFVGGITKASFASGKTAALPTDVTSAVLVDWWRGESGRYDATSGGNLVTLDGAGIASWEGVVNGVRLTQATAGKRLKKFGDYVVGQHNNAAPDT